MTEEDLLKAVERGINTRLRLCTAFPKTDPDDIRHMIATLIYRGILRSEKKRLHLV